MLLSPFEWMVTKRYMLPGKGERFIALVAGISVGVVMLSVALLIVVMSVMNGFRGELLDRFVNLNGHAIIQAYGGRLDNWEGVLEEVRETPRVTSASPMIEQPLLVTFNGRAEAIQMRGGIGFTWEEDTHLWYKRAKSSEVFMGTPAIHRERMMQLMEESS